ncbi:hypothetical protein QNH48_18410 [Neobacillus sp. YX16]|uniref:hypothetical protein n=1 Tax=Neobacillus sp. YX16 TaxID=3047874 RepID=UPI0024C45F1D|nr:hypothetical protein [Neobacillus sp. YX16]WHZ01001.1 hypothetical protein QNH48_18410 [Neobacillus sp. YX16]
MKKLALLSLISILFLFAFSKQQEVVHFLRPVANGLKQNTKVHVFLPTYWREQGGKAKKHTSVKVKAYENGYMIYFLSMDKRLSFFYKGPIRDAVKIVDSLKYIE